MLFIKHNAILNHTPNLINVDDSWTDAEARDSREI